MIICLFLKTPNVGGLLLLGCILTVGTHLYCCFRVRVFGDIPFVVVVNVNI
jgi:hypothetical protein